MSLWQRIVGGLRRGPESAAEPVSTGPDAGETGSAKAPSPPTEDSELSILRGLQGSEPPSLESALGALRNAVGTRHERAAIQAVIAAHAAGHAADALAIAGAQILVQRGEPERALALLEGIHESGALLIAADVRAERGELARALTLIERVLARDLDFPGARERQAQFSQQIGGSLVRVSALEQPTLLCAERPETDLRIVGEAGRGGAGAVYEAFDDALGRRVALKVYHRREEDRDKLEREARFGVALAGAGVVRVYDVDPERGFITMEWVPGGALRGLLKRADATLIEPIARWFDPLLGAVSRVHERGIVHADLKPANVLFRSASDPLMTDFGIARAAGEPGAGGSAGYLSPERLLGKPLSFADDVYALGRILEDALEALALAGAPSRDPCWRALVDQATSDLSSRPSDARALLEALRRHGSI